MVQIVSSSITSRNTEADGRIRVDELFVGDDGSIYSQSYLAESNTDLDAVLVVHAAQLQANLNMDNLVPPQLSPLQARRALNAAGLRAQVEAAVNASSQDVKDAWQFASYISRNDEYIIQLGAALGLSSEQLDDLFRLGATF